MVKKALARTYSTDHLMVGIMTNLVRDFQEIDGCETLADGLIEQIKPSGSFRDFDLPGVMQAPPHIFKRVAQLEKFLKRYTFTWEYERDLNSETNIKFASTQSRVAQPMTLKSTDRKVIQKARQIVSSILGHYNVEEHMDLCKFSSNATVGSSLSNAYLDSKLTKPISGSPAHISWFKNRYLVTDHLLNDSLARTKSTFTPCECLTVTNVPKAWDKLRSITPNTTLGSFYTYGLGKVIQARLQSAGLDLRYLQEHHQKMAQKYSRSLRGVTADLSAASDSFNADLVNMLVPRKWYNALKLGRIPYAKVGDDRLLLSSFMSMGIGYTFPLQTLLFYSLLKAIQELSHCYGHISVFGDDLIYPIRMHKYVSIIFPRLRLILNQDKTFVVHSFRESCGGDYYRGIDVRPCLPEGFGCLLSSQKFVTFVYKLINTLLRRWNYEEISHTIDHLYDTVYHIDGRILQVPEDMPDYAGVKVSKIRYDDVRFSLPCFSKTRQCFSFQRYVEHPRDRLVLHERFYLWDVLRGKRSEPTLWSPYEKGCDLFRLIKVIPKNINRLDRSRSEIKARLVAAVPSKKEGKTLVNTGLGFS